MSVLFSQQELSLGRPIQFLKSRWGEQPVKDIPNFTCICVYLFIYLRHASWPNEKRYRLEIWYTYSHRPYLKTGFFCFSIKSPWWLLASKHCRATGIFRISPRLPFLIFSKRNKWGVGRILISRNYVFIFK